MVATSANLIKSGIKFSNFILFNNFNIDIFKYFPAMSLLNSSFTQPFGSLAFPVLRCFNTNSKSSMVQGLDLSQFARLSLSSKSLSFNSFISENSVFIGRFLSLWIYVFKYKSFNPS